MRPAFSRWPNRPTTRSCSGSIRGAAAILPLDAFHVPRRLRRVVRQGSFEIRCDNAFEDIIRGCAEATEKRPNTWINDEIVRLYSALFARGAAHSVECLAGRQRWSAGCTAFRLAQPSSAKACSAESPTRARSRSCIWSARLRLGGYRLLDTQFLTPHLARFGGVEIPRARYRRLLAEALATALPFPGGAAGRRCGGDPLAALQSSKSRRRRRARAPTMPDSTQTSSR